MASNIDATKPTTGNALTQDVRDNFSAAKSEIEALQIGTSSDRPSFLYTLASTISNVTGDGTAYTVVFDTEIRKQGVTHNGTTLTATTAGFYLLKAGVRLSGWTGAADSMTITIATSNRSYQESFTITNGFGADQTASIAVLADMDVGDTAHVTIRVTGESLVVDVSASSGSTHFSGCLVS